MLKGSKNSWGVIAKIFHWMLAIFILVQITIGINLHFMETSPTKLGFINVHKLIGSTILLLVLARLIWRFYNTKPSNSNLSTLHRTISRIIHTLLYILIIIIPLNGMLYTWLSGYDVSILGIFNLPPLVDKDVAFAKQILPVHYNLTLLLIGILYE